MLLSMLGFSLLLWAIIEAPSRTWTAPPIIGALAASAALLAGFLLWERRRADPMLPVSFFRNRRYQGAINGDPAEPGPATRPSPARAGS